MKTTPGIPSRPVLILAALTLAVSSPAQEIAAPAPPAPEPPATATPEIHFEVQSSRTVPIGGRNLIIQRVSPPALPPPPPAQAAAPALTPEQLATRQAARAARPAPVETRLLCLTVTRYADHLSYIEWWPYRGGQPFGAWSNADFDALRMVPDVTVAPGNIRWSLFPFFIYNPLLRPAPGPVAPPQLPADGPGFLIVKGNPADTENVSPIAALHKINREKGPALKQAWAERERTRLTEEARQAASPPPPGDIVLRYWVSPTRLRKGGAQ